MNGYIEMAKLLKERNNNKTLVVTTGKVISPLPDLRIRLLDKIILDKKNLVIASHIYSHYQQSDANLWLNSGDEVILIPTENPQAYYVIDKAVHL